MRKLMCQIILFYQRYISPWFPAHCRYSPSCSQYMIEALQQHGLRKGLWLGIRRIGRCNPLGNHGYDPVPAPEPKYSETPPELTNQEDPAVVCADKTKTNRTIVGAR